jgi:hypothetical protein
MTLERWPDAYTAVSPAQCNQMLADGSTGLMVGVWGGGYAGKGTGGLYDVMQANAQNSLRNMRQVGGKTAIYSNAGPRWTYSWGTIGPKDWWAETQRAAGAELAHISFAELDFEIADTTGGGLYIQSDDMLEFIADLRTLKVPVIGYSGDWFCGLMHAAGQRYDYSGVLDGYNPADYTHGPVLAPRTWPMHPRIVGVQYSGGSNVHGVNCDLNIIDSSLYTSAQSGGLFMSLTPDQEQAILTNAEWWAWRSPADAPAGSWPRAGESRAEGVMRTLGEWASDAKGEAFPLLRRAAAGDPAIVDLAAVAKAVNDEAAKRLAS